MPQRAATIEGLPTAFALVKEMQADGPVWDEGYRPLGCRALAGRVPVAQAADGSGRERYRHAADA